MLSIKFDPDVKRLELAFKKINLDKGIRDLVETLAFGVERYSKQVTPVRTGRLRASINTRSSFGGNFRAFVSTNTDYALFVHEGTRKMRGRPFMRWGSEFAVKQFGGEDIGWRLDRELRKQLSSL